MSPEDLSHSSLKLPIDSGGVFQLWLVSGSHAYSAATLPFLVIIMFCQNRQHLSTGLWDTWCSGRGPRQRRAHCFGKIKPTPHAKTQSSPTSPLREDSV
ncbi:hypothetical protein P167DRAFT_436068 [Morchella conica CCBAS932]|uniref:Uncharacterized protein n=1 Tax=Morchella conica CCBAS932 TaxID=1392247 RepID=A0A3N4KMP0_9PEZI|nr:hypothetical protein P167DRAFT_436068 [Morchella conica CCBAS932]